MRMKVRNGLLCAAAACLMGNAAAEVVTFDFCGNVRYSNGLGPVGAPVTGQFSWDTSAPMPPPSTYPAATYSSPVTGPITFAVAGHAIAADRSSVTVYNDLGGNAGDMIDISGQSPVVVDGTTFQFGYFSIRLASSPLNTTVFQDTSLPADLDVSKFDSQGLNYFQMLSGVAYNDLMLDVDLKWIRRAGNSFPGSSERRLCPPGASQSKQHEFQCCPSSVGGGG